MRYQVQYQAGTAGTAVLEVKIVDDRGIESLRIVAVAA
jgi:hypothetical protein